MDPSQSKTLWAILIILTEFEGLLELYHHLDETEEVIFESYQQEFLVGSALICMHLLLHKLVMKSSIFRAHEQ